VNIIWQGDANSWCLRSFAHCQSPASILNITGPETLSVREIALLFGRLFGVNPEFSNTEGPTALLNNAARAGALFGAPTVSPAEMIEWTARWIQDGGATLDKPTHFQTRDGNF
jgi:nucleoside-diphosphate-sugar epimerase